MGVNKQKIIENQDTKSKKNKPRFKKTYKTTDTKIIKGKEQGKNTFKIKLERRKSKNKKYIAKQTIKDNGFIHKKGKRLPKQSKEQHIPKKSIKKIIQVDKDTKAYVFKTMTRVETSKIKETKRGDFWQIVADVKAREGTKIIKRRFGSTWKFHSDTINAKKIEREREILMEQIERLYEPISVDFKINYYRPNVNF